MKLHPFLTTFQYWAWKISITQLCPSEQPVASDVFPMHGFDECFGKIDQVIIIADDIMIVSYNPDHSDHDQAFTNLLQTGRKSVMLNSALTSSSTSRMKSGFFGETYTTNGHKPSKDKVSSNHIHAITSQQESEYNSLFAWSTT